MNYVLFAFRRLAMLAPTLFGVSVISFLLVYMLPGNPALVKAGAMATPEYIAEMEHKMGLDQPVYIQYERYIAGLFRRRSRRQLRNRAARCSDDFVQRLPATLELTLASLVLAMPDRRASGGSVGDTSRQRNRPFRPSFRGGGRGNAELLEWSHPHLRILLCPECSTRAVGPARHGHSSRRA